MLKLVLLGPEDTGLGPQVQGDPMIALLAQLNRFAGRTLNAGVNCTGCKKTSSRRYVAAPYPLVANAFNLAAATSAVMLLVDRYQYVPDSSFDKRLSDWAMSGYDDPMSFVLDNTATIVPMIAQFGDRLGLDPAEVGITERDPRIPKPFPTGKVVAAVGVVGAVAAFVLMKRGA